MLYIDGHCDTLSVLLDDKCKIDNQKYAFNIIDAKKVAPVIQMAAAFINPKYKDGFKRANDILDYYLKNKQDTVLIKTKNDLYNVIDNKKIGIFLTIENGKAIEDDLKNVDILYNKGIRLMSINWNEDNLLGTGANTKSKLGLTEFGKKYVKKLEQKNIIIDISHSSEQTFWDTIAYTKKVIVATHSCCYNICNHPRNLKDEQIKEIAKRGGVIGICLCSTFLCNSKKASISDVIKNIAYIINLVGEDFVALGTDFDGVEEEFTVTDLKGIKDMPKLLNCLKEYGYSERTINKIMGENWLRIIKNALL